ncbi:hypothetical protein ACMV8I_15570 [Ewingella sp. S1.OA.A_B6]
MNKLYLGLIEKTSQYGSQWVDLSVKKDDSLISLFRGRVNISELLDWFRDNEEEIKSSDLPINEPSSGSLAKKIQRFYEYVEIEDDEIVDAMFDYRACHCLRFAARGTNFPEIYIGKKVDGHEISLFTDEQDWQYFIDIDDFFLI